MKNQLTRPMSGADAIARNHEERVMAKEPKVLSEIRIKEAENGGHIVSHHFEHYTHEPETHVFGAKEGSKLVAHVVKAAKIKLAPAEGEGGGET